MSNDTGRFQDQTEITRRYVHGEISPEEFFAWVRAESSASLSEDEARWIGQQRAKDLRDDESRATTRAWVPFHRRRQLARDAWLLWSKSDKPMSVKFEAGFHLGMRARREAEEGVK